MASLVALSPAHGRLPVTHGSVTLSELWPDAITSVAPFRGREAEVSAALEAATGLRFPAPNRSSVADGLRAIRTAPDTALVIGATVAPEGAALTDQTDAWAVLRLEGAAARDVLARHVPADLRPSVFKRNHVAQTLLGHMTATIWREGADSYGIAVFRSMAGTAVHELDQAMRAVAARG